MGGSMQRGFACISLVNPKTPQNVGGALRAAGCYGAAQVGISGNRGTHTYNRWIKHGTNTSSAHRHTPTMILADALDYRPVGTQVIVVELIDGAIDLPAFHHPDRALYVFGPEDGTIGKGIIDRAQHIVRVPTMACMNLAATVNVVLYDRAAKGRPFGLAYPPVDFSHLYRRPAARQAR